MDTFIERKRLSESRKYELDWLRSLTMCAVFLFHCARLFDAEDWSVKNGQLDYGMTILVNGLALWIMPVLFFISGCSACYSLNKVSYAADFLWERIKRLVIPLVFAQLTMLWLQVYYERVSHGQFAGSLADFYPHYFDGFYLYGGNFALVGMHLWYLLFLFVFTLLLMPLFVFGKTNKGHHMLLKLTGFFHPALYLLLFIPIIPLELDLSPLPRVGGWNLASYLFVFLYGYLFASDASLREKLQKYRSLAAGCALLSLAILFSWDLLAGGMLAGSSSAHFLFVSLRAFTSWCLVLALIGYASRYLSFQNAILQYANPLVMPFYILHQTVIITLGFYIVPWNLGVAAKYLLVSTVSFGLIILLYEAAIKRINWLRFFFGMKPK